MTAPPAAPGRSSVFDSLEIVVDPDLEVDAARLGRLLVLRDGQTHENAVDQLVKMFPDAHVDDVTSAVRKAMPHAPSLDNLALQIGASTPAWVTGESAPMVTSMSKRRIQAIACGVTAGIAAVSVGLYALLATINASPFDSPEFAELAKAANFQCKTQSDSQAECRNVRTDTIWKVTAFEGVKDDPTSFRFSHGSELAVVWVFNSAEERAAFPQLKGYQRLYPLMSSRDRVLVGATDAEVMADLAGALDASLLDGVGNEPGSAATSGSPFSGWPTKMPTPLVPWPTSGSTRTVSPVVAPQSPAPAGTATQAPPAAPESPERPVAGPAPTPTATEPPAADTGTPQPPAATPEPTPPTDAPGGQGQPNADKGPTRLAVTITLPGIRIGI